MATANLQKIVPFQKVKLPYYAPTFCNGPYRGSNGKQMYPKYLEICRT